MLLKRLPIFIAAFVSIGCLHSLQAQPLYVLPDGVETRWASPENPRGEKGAGGQANAGRKGSPFFALKAGEQLVLAEAANKSGVVRRIWMTISDPTPKLLRGVRLDMYWDGAATPAVSAPLGDFFGLGLGQMAAFQSAIFSSPEGRSFNCFAPMPFKTGMRIVLTNETDNDIRAVYYDVDYTIGDRLGNDIAYFHAHFRRENPTHIQRDYEFVPKVEGKGRFLGVNVGVIVDKAHYASTWWGEGEVKMYIDGDAIHPTLNGTGTEDYIGSGWTLGPYAQFYQGAPIADKEKLHFCFYRYHILDPVYFHHDLRVTMQQIGFMMPQDLKNVATTAGPLYLAGPGLVELEKNALTPFQAFERADDWSSCAYFYLDQPENKLPPLQSVAERTRGL